MSHKQTNKVRQWWHMPLIAALRRQRQVDLCEFETNLVYRVCFRTGSQATEKLSQKNKNKNKQKTKQTNQPIKQHLSLPLPFPSLFLLYHSAFYFDFLWSKLTEIDKLR